jgi:hypothetical protein
VEPVLATFAMPVAPSREMVVPPGPLARVVASRVMFGTPEREAAWKVPPLPVMARVVLPPPPLMVSWLPKVACPATSGATIVALLPAEILSAPVVSHPIRQLPSA